MSIKRSGSTPSLRTLVATHPAALGLTELHIVNEALAETAPSWTADLQGICVEEATLVILPEGGDDMMGPSFALSRDSTGYRVHQVHWDLLTEVGRFAVFADAVAAICHHISFSVPLMAPALATRH
jgi:hypothetical protein